MKKIAIFVFPAIVLCSLLVVLAGCSKNASIENKIIGTWQYTSTAQFGESTFTQGNNQETINKIEFAKDKTCIFYLKNNVKEYGVWAVNNDNSVTVYINGQVDSATYTQALLFRYEKVNNEYRLTTFSYHNSGSYYDLYQKI